MSESVGLILLFTVGGAVAGPILALVALSRFNSLSRLTRNTEKDDARLEALERRVTSLLERITMLERAERAPSPPPSHTPAPARPIEPPPVKPVGPIVPEPSRAAPAAPSQPPPSKPLWMERPPEPPPPPAPPIDWEQWIGIRGAAVVGAVALGLAGLLFFKYSIEHALITPAMRVVLGTLTGLGCLVGSEWLRGRGYRQTAEGISGAGVVVLYAAFWAAHTLYQLIGMPVAFGLMVLVTTGCCLLAVRHGSLLVAVFGLVGGFATPLLLSSDADRPFGFFGYVLLLDLGLLAVGRKRRWPSLGVLSLLGTCLMQALWIVNRMGPERLFLALAILVVFALLFVVAGRFAGRDAPQRGWTGTQVGAILFPFLFALYFAGQTELGPHLYPIAILLGLLGAGAGWVSREQKAPMLGTAAAGASVGVVAVWLAQHALTAPLAWEMAGVGIGLALVFHIFVELDPQAFGFEGPMAAALIAALGMFLLLLFGAVSEGMPMAPWLTGWAALAAILYRHAAFPDRGSLQWLAALGIGVGLTILHGAHFRGPRFPSPSIFLALLVGAALALHAVALLRRGPDLRRFADQAAGLLPMVLLVGLTPAPFTSSLSPLPVLGTALLLGLLSMIAATRLGKGAWAAGAAAATFLVHLGWTVGRDGLRDRPSECTVAFLLLAAAVVVFTTWPFANVRRFSEDRLAWYAAALAGPIWFMPMKRLFVWSFGDAFLGVLPVLLGGLSLAAAHRARRAWPASDPIRQSALAWLAATALCFFAVAIPLQLEKEWITIGWALEGLAVIALWTRLDHPGLKYFGLALLAATSLRLVANVELLGYYPRSGLRIVNWLMYTYLVPAAALLGSAALLRRHEVERARPWEPDLYTKGHPLGASGAGLAAIAVVFVWINMAIADWFATGPALTLNLGGPPAQRLTVSIAWAIYALILLGFGMARDTLGLRWISLCFLLITIGKVFLYDLGALRDLYRVASLVGLAVSLILVSLLYQRFVFGKDRAQTSRAPAP
ncbi:MAG: DUF2339 domain-containing protein [Candidatus Polarisedimenticolia bacterium]